MNRLKRIITVSALTIALTASSAFAGDMGGGDSATGDMGGGVSLCSAGDMGGGFLDELIETIESWFSL